MTRILGLTGSIAMGKSTVAAQLKRFGAVISNADGIVHALLAPGGEAERYVAGHFPDCLNAQGHIDRRLLGRLVFEHPESLAKLEAILHPLVRRAHHRAIRRAVYQRRRWVVLEIPLLYETQAERLCDAVLVVSAPAFMQRQRALAREGMDETRLRRILERQMPDQLKRRRADAVIVTGLGRRESLRQVSRALAIAQGRRSGRACCSNR